MHFQKANKKMDTSEGPHLGFLTHLLFLPFFTRQIIQLVIDTREGTLRSCFVSMIHQTFQLFELQAAIPDFYRFRSTSYLL